LTQAVEHLRLVASFRIAGCNQGHTLDTLEALLSAGVWG
jgi:hypothetical protein